MKAVLAYFVTFLIALGSAVALIKAPSSPVLKMQSTLQLQLDARKEILNTL